MPAAHFQEFTFVHCLPHQRLVFENAKFRLTLAQEQVQMTVQGNKSTVPACFHPQKAS